LIEALRPSENSALTRATWRIIPGDGIIQLIVFQTRLEVQLQFIPQVTSLSAGSWTKIFVQLFSFRALHVRPQVLHYITFLIT
jgi:hypothetical protein